MKYKLIIITSGINLPINVKYLSYKLYKNNISYLVLSQKSNSYISDKFIIKKKGLFFFLLVKLGGLFKKIIKNKKNRYPEIFNYFKINTSEYRKFVPNIEYKDNINSYIEKELEVKYTIFLSLGAPIIKKKSINKINSMGSIFLNSHIGTSNYPGITPYVWASYKEDFKNIGFILHSITNKIDKGDIFFEKNIELKSLYNTFGTFDINFLSIFLLLFSADNIFLYLSNKDYKLSDNDIIYNTYDKNIKSYFISNYFYVLIANYNLKKYFKTQC